MRCGVISKNAFQVDAGAVYLRTTVKTRGFIYDEVVRSWCAGGEEGGEEELEGEKVA